MSTKVAKPKKIQLTTRSAGSREMKADELVKEQKQQGRHCHHKGLKKSKAEQAAEAQAKANKAKE